MNLRCRSTAPVPPPDPDALIAQLARDKADLRDRLTRAEDLIAYQRGRMKDMATELLGNQAVLARYQQTDRGVAR